MKAPTTPDDWDRAFEGSDPPTIGSGSSTDPLERNRYLAPLVRPGMRVLEAGCGGGKFVRAYARAGAFSIGIDFSVRETGKVRRELDRQRMGSATVLAGDLMEMPLANDSLDLYSSFGVYEHFLPHQHRVLFAEALRVLKPGGLMYVEVPHAFSPWTIRRQIRYWYRSWRPPTLVWQRNLSRRYLTRVAERQGFRTVASHVSDAWSGFAAGFSLDQPRIKALPNPFYLARPLLKRLAAYCESREWMGYSLVYIGRKEA